MWYSPFWRFLTLWRCRSFDSLSIPKGCRVGVDEGITVAILSVLEALTAKWMLRAEQGDA